MSQTGNLSVPDIVIIQSNQVTDIFELKFVLKQKEYPVFENDIKKLLNYSGKKPVKLDLTSENLNKEALPISADCRLHFVVVGNHNSDAVWPDKISSKVFLWFGRVGKGHDQLDWGICKGKELQR